MLQMLTNKEQPEDSTRKVILEAIRQLKGLETKLKQILDEIKPKS